MSDKDFYGDSISKIGDTDMGHFDDAIKKFDNEEVTENKSTREEELEYQIRRLISMGDPLAHNILRAKVDNFSISVVNMWKREVVRATSLIYKGKPNGTSL